MRPKYDLSLSEELTEVDIIVAKLLFWQRSRKPNRFVASFLLHWGLDRSLLLPPIRIIVVKQCLVLLFVPVDFLSLLCASIKVRTGAWDR
jgi:hypothetical protein